MRHLLLTLIIWSLTGCDAPVPWVNPITLNCNHTLELQWETTHESVELLSLTDTQHVKRTPLSLDIDSGIWSIQLDRSVEHLYLFSVDGQPIIDVHAPLSLDVNGRRWSTLKALDCSQPRLAFVQREQHQGRTVLTVQLQRAHPDHGLDAHSITAETKSDVLPTHVIDDQILIDITEIPIGKHWLSLQARDKRGTITQPFQYPFWVGTDDAFDWSNTNVYQIVTDRFSGFDTTAPDHWTIGAYRGGTWAGIEQQIERKYFSSLGINALWISPVNDNPAGLWVGVEGGEPKYAGYHGYWRTSNTRINPAFGTEASLRSLVDTAHTHGIRVILDVVLNHRHQNFDDVPSSIVRANSACICGHAICPWWSDIERCWFTPYLPDVNYGDPRSIAQELEALTALLKQFDFDGIRVDAVPMMPQFVIRHLKAQMVSHFEGLDSKFLILGETYTGPSGYDSIRYYLGQHGLDGQFDFPLMWMLRNVFAHGSGSSRDLVDAWRSSERAWRGSGSSMATMIGNHDVPRFASVAAQQQVSNPWGAPPEQVTEQQIIQRALMAQSFVMAMPGIWTLYYGDEIALVGAQDPDNRRPYPWHQALHPTQHRLHAHLKILGRSRRCLFNDLDAEVGFETVSDTQITITRLDKHNDQLRLIVMIDRDASSAETRFLTSGLNMRPGQRWIDVLSDEIFTSTIHGLTVETNTTGVRWLLPATDRCAKSGEL